MGFQWFSTCFFLVYVYPGETMGFPRLRGRMFFQGQAEEKRAEAEMEELKKHRVAWPENCREMGVS